MGLYSFISGKRNMEESVNSTKVEGGTLTFNCESSIGQSIELPELPI